MKNSSSKKSRVHIYKGEGKGKTSILNGATIRMLGQRKKVLYLRFLKNRPSGEIKYWNNINVQTNIQQKESAFLVPTIKSFYQSSIKFFWEMNDEEKNKLKQETLEGINALEQALLSDDFDLIVADELLGCIQNNLVTTQKIIELLSKRTCDADIMISGRYCSNKLIEVSDLVSTINKTKHYFDNKQNSIAFKIGIEY